TMRGMFRQFAAEEQDGRLRVSLATLEEFHQSQPPSRTWIVDWMTHNARWRLSGVNRNLYPSGTDSLEKMVHIEQGRRGNCYLHSGFGAMAAVDPKWLQNVIVECDPD